MMKTRSFKYLLTIIIIIISLICLTTCKEYCVGIYNNEDCVFVDKQITIIAPDNTSEWEAGTKQTIAWTTDGDIKNVRVEIYNEDKIVLSDKSETDVLKEVNSIDVVIPFLTESNNSYKVKITDASNSDYFAKSDYFKIYRSIPYVESITPFDKQIDIKQDHNITIDFSEEIDTESAIGNIYLIENDNTFITSEVSWNSDKTIATIIPDEPIKENMTKYSIIIDSSIKDLSGNTMEQSVISTFITDDHDKPRGNIIIENGREFVNYLSVEVDLSNIAGAYMMRLAVSQDELANTSWEEYAELKRIELPDGDGEKTVYAEFLDGLDQTFIATDTVIYDTDTSSGIIIINNDDISTNIRTVSIDLSDIQDAVKMRFSNDLYSIIYSKEWEDFSTEREWELSLMEGEKIVYAQFMNLAGNIYYTADSIFFDESEPEGYFVINSDTEYINTKDVTLNNYITDKLCFVEQMRFSNDNVFDDPEEAWQSFQSNLSWTLTDGDGEKTVYAEFIDNAGNVYSCSDNVIVNTLLDYVQLSNTPHDPTQDTFTNIITGGDNIVSYKYLIDSGVYGNEILISEHINEYSLIDGTHTIKAIGKNTAGSWQPTASPTIYTWIVDTVEPFGYFTVKDTDAPYIEYSNQLQVVIDSSTIDDLTTFVRDMRFGNSETERDNAEWVSFNNLMDWGITSGDGLKTVYAEYRDNAGNIYQDIDTITLDTIPPDGEFYIENDYIYALSVTVELNNNVNGADEMRFSNDGITWTGWEAFSSTKTWDLDVSDGEGTKTVYAEFRDYAGNTINRSDMIFLDSIPPSGEMLINSGAKYANEINVMLLSNIRGAYQIRFSNDGTSWTDWESFSVVRNWQLENNTGTRTVYAEYRDRVGHVLSLSDTIILDPSKKVAVLYETPFNPTMASFCNIRVGGNDIVSYKYSIDGSAWSSEISVSNYLVKLNFNEGSHTVKVIGKSSSGAWQSTSDPTIYTWVVDFTPPRGSFYINDTDVINYGYANGRTVRLEVGGVVDELSGVTQARFGNTETERDNATWQTFELTGYSWDLTATDGLKTVYAEFKDHAGSSLFKEAQIILDTTPPSISSFRINNNATYSTSSSVSLNYSVSGASRVRYKNGGSSYTSWEGYSPTRGWTVPTPDGNKTVYAEYSDFATNTVSTNDSIILDTTAPSGSFYINGGNPAYTMGYGVTLYSSVSDNISGVTTRVKNSGGSYTSWMSYSTTRGWTLPNYDGGKTVYAQFKDDAGNIRTFSDNITVDTVRPNIHGFTVTSSSKTANPNISFTANVTEATSGIAGWKVTFSPTEPSWSSGGWTSSKPSTIGITPGVYGVKTFYLWCKDNAGWVSNYGTGTVEYVAPGTIAWDYAFVTGNNDIPYDICTVGEQAVIGGTGDFGLWEDWVIVKLDKNGNNIWQRSYQGGNQKDELWDIEISGNAIYGCGSGDDLITGDTDMDFWVQSFNSTTGAVNWQYPFQGGYFGWLGDSGYCVEIDKSGNIWYGGFLDDWPLDEYNREAAAFKFAPNGAHLLTVHPPGTNHEEEIYDIVVDSSNYLYFIGKSGKRVSPDSGYDTYVWKYNSAGALISQRGYDISLSNNWAKCADIDTNDHIYIGGFSDNIGGSNPSSLLIKIDRNLNLLGYVPFGISGDNQILDISVDKRNNNVYTAGYKSDLGYNNFVVRKFNSSLAQIDIINVGGVQHSRAYSVDVDDYGNVYVGVSQPYAPNTGKDWVIYKYIWDN